MEAICYSKICVEFYLTTQCYIPEGRPLHSYVMNLIALLQCHIPYVDSKILPILNVDFVALYLMKMHHKIMCNYKMFH
jgi:hypothetical protein